MTRSPGCGCRGTGGSGYPGKTSAAQDSDSGLPGLPIRPVTRVLLAAGRAGDEGLWRAAPDVPAAVQPARIAQVKAGTSKGG